jgi:predicted transcriptional regulator
MTKLLDEAISRVRALPAKRQNAVAELLLGLAAQSPHLVLTDEQLADVRLGLEEARNGQFATDEEMSDLWRKFGL